MRFYLGEAAHIKMYLRSGTDGKATREVFAESKRVRLPRNLVRFQRIYYDMDSGLSHDCARAGLRVLRARSVRAVGIARGDDEHQDDHGND